MVVAFASPTADSLPQSGLDRHSMQYFRHEMWRTVRADHPAIVPIANAIRTITRDPLQQLVMVNDVTHLLVDYDSDARVYGVEDFHATLDEMIARRRAAGWAYLRDDCDGRAVFAAHILASLGIEWRFEASYWKEHAWVIATVKGVDYDLLDLRRNAPETDRLAYKLVGHWFVHPSRPPPHFDWREAWAVETHRNLRIGLTLGMLTLDSSQYAMHSRHSNDWTVIAPDSTIPPLDDARTLMTGIAAFPYGESLHVAALASVRPTPPANPAKGTALSAPTGAKTSAP